MQNLLVQFLILFGLCAVGTLLILILAGLIGPNTLKEKMRRQVRWYWGPASPLVPMDPYKPISEALNQKASDFGSTKERIKNNNLVILGQLLLTFGLLALGLVLYILWRAHTE